MTTRLQWILCFVVCFFMMSPIFLALNISGSVVLLALAVLTLTANRVRFSRAHTVTYILVVLFVISSCLSAFFNGVIEPIVFSLFFVLSVLTVLQTKDVNARAMVGVASWIFAVFIVMAFVGVIYHLLGGEPLFTLANSDGRDNHFYLTTFSNAETFAIRPSAIYDEPGAFSFYICMLVILRSRLGLSLKGSAALLLGGLITQSIVHVMFAFLWFIWVLQHRDASVSTLRDNLLKRFYFALFFVLSAFIVYQSGLLGWALERAAYYYDNPWANPRHNALNSIISAFAMNPGGVWFGFEKVCVQRLPGCSGMGENPLTPLIYGGLFSAWPYYLFLLVAIVAPLFSRDGLLLVGATLLLLQRPYFLEFPYSALFALGFVVWFIPKVGMPRSRAFTLSPPKKGGILYTLRKFDAVKKE